ncbi:MAG: HlyD family type I secretion periplasmic adaptor subunit [Acetobacteraceae bacterium]|nr:HlyD family type I secretion periplasmic adaptor subunit [Acetobacteraceae bacterium]
MSLTLGGSGNRGRGSKELTVTAQNLPSLLEFHSPTNALTVTPVLHAARPVTWMVVTLVGACFAASALIPIDKVVTAPGRIIAENPTSVVQPLETAIIRSINVHEGDTVKKGELLARLDPTFATADMGAMQSQVASLQAEVDRLQAEASGTDYHPADGSSAAVLQGAIFVQRKAERAYKNENYTQKISSLQNQVQRALSDVYGYSERLKVAAEVEARRLELERDKVGSTLNRLAATDSRLEVKRGLDNAAAQAAQADRDLKALEAERDAYNQNWRAQVGQDLTEATRKLSDAQENLKKAVLRRQLVELRADQDSVVLNVAKVSPGSVMQSGEQLITLVPVDAPLEAEVNIPGSEAGFVHPGNPVNIKLDTLPYTQYGTVTGTVRVVSPDSFAANQDDQQQPKRGVQQSRPVGGSTYYRARLTLDESKLHDTPDGFRLIPGMPLNADVKVGKRTLVSYLLGRVLPTFKDGMREP